MATTTASVTDVCLAAKAASRELAKLDGAARDAALIAMAEALESRSAEILDANRRDMEQGEADDLTAALLDRLRLTRSGSRGSPATCARSPRCPIPSAR